MAKADHEWPTKESVKALFRELNAELNSYHYSDSGRNSLGAERDALAKELDQLEKDFRHSPPYSDLSRRLKLVEKQVAKRRDAIRKKMTKVRQNYLLQGPTTTILNALQRIVDELNEGKLD